MKRISFLPAIFFLAAAVNAQNVFTLKDASKDFDICIDVGTCDSGIHEGLCGPVKIAFFRKNNSKAFQTIRLSKTEMMDPVPKANIILGYDDQSMINFDDFNFDGKEDVAICDGTNGGYGMPSYRVYIYSPSRKRFVYSSAFTKMNEGGLGMFQTEKRKKRHFVFTKSGCCWHQTQGFDVFRGRPRKVFEFTEAILGYQPETVEITTSKLVHGKWRTWVKHAKTSEYYK